MTQELENIRGQLQNQAAEIWDSSEEDIQQAIQELREFFGEDARQTFLEAAESSGSLRDNMTAAAQEHGVKQEFLSRWQSDDTLQRLQYEVKNAFQNVWAGNTEASDQLYKAFQDANISELNTVCAEGDYSQVMEMLGDPDESSPTNFAECARLVAKVQDIGTTLEGMYRG